MAKRSIVINERVETDTNTKVELIESPGIWTVFYKGKPFNLRRTSEGKFPIYSKIAFPAPGHAKALCRRLSELFRSNKFTVVHLGEEHD